MPEPPSPRLPYKPKPVLEALAKHEVDFVLIGGLAGMVHGSSYPTYDIDIAYARSPQNIERLAAVLRELKATLRGAPPDTPFQLDASTLAKGDFFTFDTIYGPFDIMGVPAGVASYEQLKETAKEAVIDGQVTLVASLDYLIAMKRASGRRKDELMVDEYIALTEEQKRMPKG